MITLLKREETIKCRNFCEEFVKIYKSVRDFGTSGLREIKDQIADCTAGKLGEKAFQVMMIDYHNMEIGLDFVPDKGDAVTDEGKDILTVDGVTPKYKFDIKAIKMFSHWFLYEATKLAMIESDVFIVVKTGIPKDFEESLFIPDPLKCVYCGYFLKEDLFDLNGRPKYHFMPGELLPDPRRNGRFLNVRLKAENIGLPILTAKDNVLDLIELLRVPGDFQTEREVDIIKGTRNLKIVNKAEIGIAYADDKIYCGTCKKYKWKVLTRWCVETDDPIGDRWGFGCGDHINKYKKDLPSGLF